MTIRPDPRALVAALLGLALGACGGSLYDAAGVPRLQGGSQCRADQHLCAATGNVCQAHDLDHCGSACAVCTTGIQGATATCEPGGGDFQCGYRCAAGLFKCTSGCCQPTAVAAGGDQSCAVTTDGSVQCWGANLSGQLGRPGVGGPVPQQVTGFSSGVTALAVGRHHACAIRSGTVWCWGDDQLGQLGDGAAISSGPTPVSAGLTSLPGSARLVAGADHTCVLSAGSVRCWGANAKGQLGTGAGTVGVNLPAPSAPAILTGVDELAARADNTCARQGGQVQCWGANGSGQVGSGVASAAPIPAPTPVVGLTGVTTLAVGGLHACAVVGGAAGVDGELTCWGENGKAQLGTTLGATPGTPVLAPTPARGFDSQARAVRAIAGTEFTCAARDATGLKCFGQNDQGQAGGGLNPMVEGNDLTFGGNLLGTAPDVDPGVVAGADHGCGLVDLTPLGPPTRVVKCWGRNVEGQLGRATTGTFDGSPGTVGQ
jgi:alpha-tubulin suppressor-like RCC1 family protein